MFERDKKNPNILRYDGLDQDGNPLPSGHIPIEEFVADQLTSIQEKFFLVAHNSTGRYLNFSHNPTLLTDALIIQLNLATKEIVQSLSRLSD